MTTQVTVSKHALERLKERLGLNRKAAKRQAVLAWERGVQPQHYAIKEWRELYSWHQEQDDSVMLLIYNDMLYVWGLKDGCPNLVTVPVS